MSDIRWLALESNPEVLNKYIQALGVSNDKYRFVDVWGTDPELLAMVPNPVIALLFLFPVTGEDEEDEDEQEISENIWYMKQNIANACGTIAVIHALANNEEKFDLDESSPLYKFLLRTKRTSPDEKADALEKEEEISEAHENTANEGQTETPELDSAINLHFVAFVEKDGGLYELDGRLGEVVRHGSTTPETFLTDAAAICKKVMDRNPEENDFSMMALVATPLDQSV
eukprot:TRINITY_DN7001_c0_g1_i2.p1 TRINITY_DN7001_c0_g1~~TRINITY_DN7001_c0_g1_i2.p1  ORF type:complete len:229 (+),score=77.27 TRINITY_DN7001_c0_g1_i2:112-798(+)